VDLPCSFAIRERGHRIHNPFSSEKLATLGQASNLAPGARMLDLACGSGEMLCTWARAHHITGTGVDISTVFLAGAEARAIELDVAEQVTFIHGDASNHDDFHPLPDLLAQFGDPGCDVVEMVLADQDSWDRNVAAQWLNIRRWLDTDPDDELADRMRVELATAPAQYARYQREYLGRRVFALMNR